MFKNVTMAAISSLATLFSHAGYAEHVYVGASYALLDGCSTEITDDASIRSGYGRIGAYFNESISAEIRGGTGINEDQVGAYEISLDRWHGAYIRGGMFVKDTLFPYVILGYTHQEVSGSSSLWNDFTQTKSDFSYGLGVDFSINKRISLNAEYMMYITSEDSGAQGLSVGIIGHF